MTQVDFYLLPEGEADPLPFACRLLEKIYGLGHRVYVLAASAAQASKLDTQLWSYRPGSFVPHGLHGHCDPTEVAIVIGDCETDAAHNEVILNLQTEVPLSFSGYDRLVELVESADPQRELARQRYRFYRERGYPLESHQVPG
ncbi:MAG: DNA polymerase III subunit chi [Gammaproteobacteria bacterium]|nr:DNA polymerase III subunit chi [Gammaproteobacteria bacterium]